MDMSELLRMGAAAFMESSKSGAAGSALDSEALISALTGLTGGQEGLDIGRILDAMQSGGLADIAQSWLGDGQNEALSEDNVTQLLGADKVSDFASQLGVSQEEAIGGLQDALPTLIDKASSGGSLLDSLGGIGGAINMASNIFGK